ncbi:MAG: metal-dependent transcriptional regulator [Nanoarchaeota archaeon]|nr:metal-dependent transcriptional regulator [Nanoarchaeota archaeon]
MVNLTPSIEDYLEAIYIIRQEQKVVRIKHIANLLNVSLPSVSEATNKIKKAGLVEKEKYGYIYLTDEGEILAKEIYAKHKMLLSFLNKILKVDEKIALEEACAIEHYLSNETIAKLKKFVKKYKKNGGK